MSNAPTSAHRKRELKKLATYLGVRTSHRFRRKDRMTVSEANWRVRMFVFAAILAIIGIWSLCREFF